MNDQHDHPKPELDHLLDHYRVRDADAEFMQHIMKMTTEVKQDGKFSWNLGNLLSIHQPSWKMEVAAFAMIALFGFWLGNATTNASAPATTEQISSSDSSADLNKIIFGPTTLKEVNL